MRRVVVLALGVAALAPLAACEAIVGIEDKTLAGSSDDPSVPCAQQPPYLFCDDFDEQPEAGDTWEWDTPNGTASIELTKTPVRTPPNAVAIASAADPSSSAQLGQDVSNLQTGFRLAFDLYVDESDLGSIAQVGVAQVNTATANLSFNYVLGPGATCTLMVFEGNAQSQILDKVLPLPGLRTWTRIVLVYDATDGVSVLEDGATLTSGNLAGRGAPGVTGIIMGAVYVNPPGSTPIQLVLDDVVLRGQ
jgi:hypothetical protein